MFSLLFSHKENCLGCPMRNPHQRSDMSLLFFPHCRFETRGGKNPRPTKLCELRCGFPIQKNGMQNKIRFCYVTGSEIHVQCRVKICHMNIPLHGQTFTSKSCVKIEHTTLQPLSAGSRSYF